MAKSAQKAKGRKAAKKPSPIENPRVLLAVVVFTALSIVFAVTAYINY